MSTHVFLRIHVYTYRCAYIYMYIYVYIMRILICLAEDYYRHIYICIHICIHIQIYTYVHVYTCIHIHDVYHHPQDSHTTNPTHMPSPEPPPPQKGLLFKLVDVKRREKEDPINLQILNSRKIEPGFRRSSCPRILRSNHPKTSPRGVGGIRAMNSSQRVSSHT